MDRPTTWDDYIGQDDLKDLLRLHIESAYDKDERLDHILLTGPPGCGKTTLASLIAQEMHSPFVRYVMPLDIKTIKIVVMQNRGIVMLDEIHSCSVKEQEFLMPLIEEGFLQMPNGARVEAHPWFSVIAATTNPEKIIKPLYDRFSINPSFEEYSDDDMAKIVLGMAFQEELDISYETAMQLGKATGGLPRMAERLIRTAIALNHRLKRTPEANEVLEVMKITPDGLNQDQMKYLTILKENGDSMGLDMLKNHLRLPKDVILENERLLLKRNLISYTKSGRELTTEGFMAVKE